MSMELTEFNAVVPDPFYFSIFNVNESTYHAVEFENLSEIFLGLVFCREEDAARAKIVR